MNSSEYVDEKGHRVIVKDGVPRFPGSIIDGEETMSIVADTTERAVELLERARRQLAEKGRSIQGYEQTTKSGQRPRISRTISIDLSVGVRFASKLGLAFGAEVFDEGWRRSTYAEQLRTWLWSEKPVDDDGETLAWVPRTVEDYPISDPPTHVVHFTSTKHGVAVAAVLLGTMPLVAPVEAPGAQLPKKAWTSAPGSGGVRVTTLDELAMEAAVRSGLIP